MNTVKDNSFSKKDKAKNWLGQLPSPAVRVVLDEYPNGPIFECAGSNTVIEFLLKCAAYEEYLHLQDVEMDGIVLSIELEFGTMDTSRLELSFTFSNPEQEGSISYTLSATKCPNGSYQVFGDEEYRHLS